MINNPRIYEDAANEVKNMLACANTPNRHNAIFRTDDLNHGMLKRVVVDSSTGGCTNATRSKHCDAPFDKWCASAIKGIKQNALQHAFEEKMAVQLDICKRLSMFPKKSST